METGVGGRKKTQLPHQKNLISHFDTHETREGGVGGAGGGGRLWMCVCVYVYMQTGFHLQLFQHTPLSTDILACLFSGGHVFLPRDPHPTNTGI